MADEVSKFLADPIAYAKKVCINLQTTSGAGSELKAGEFNANNAYSPLPQFRW